MFICVISIIIKSLCKLTIVNRESIGVEGPSDFPHEADHGHNYHTWTA